MPKATVSAEPIHKDLKTLPDGFVLIRQHGFGQTLSRRDKAARYLQEINPNSKPGDISTVEIDLLQEASTKYDFIHCIIDHNLEDDHGNKLDFNNPIAFDVLDPKTGMEIAYYIDEVNGSDFDPRTFTTPSGASQMSTGETSPNGGESL